jgi:hypothetical protein
MNVEDLTNTELATCVDEYFKRAMQAAHTTHEDARAEWCSFTVTASCSNLHDEYEIQHQVICGWGNSIKITGNNIIRDGVKAMNRYLNDKRDHQPTKVQPLLAAPKDEDSNIEDAQFDDVPF